MEEASEGNLFGPELSIPPYPTPEASSRMRGGKKEKKVAKFQLQAQSSSMTNLYVLHMAALKLHSMQLTGYHKHFSPLNLHPLPFSWCASNDVVNP